MGIFQRQAIKNSAYSYIGIAIGFLNILILQPVILSPEQFGLTRVILSYSVLLSTLFPLGLNGVIIKYFPKIYSEKFISNSFLTYLYSAVILSYLVFAGVVFLLEPTILNYYGYKSELITSYFTLTYLIVFVMGINSISSSISASILQTSFPTFLNEIFLRIFFTFLLALYYFNVIDFNGFIYLFVFSYCLQSLFLFYHVYRKFNFRFNWKPVFSKALNFKEMLGFGIFILVVSLASISLKNIDILIVGYKLSLQDVAIYSVALVIGNLVETPSGALTKIADIKISHAYAKNDMKEIEKIYSKSCQILSFVGALLFALLYVNIDEFLKYLPAEYSQGKWVIIIVGFGAFVNMITGINTSIITLSDKHKYIIFVLIFVLAFFITSNIVLIDQFGIKGAAISIASTMVIYNALKFYVVWKLHRINPLANYLLVNILLILISISASYLNLFEYDILNAIVKSFLVLMLFIISSFKFHLFPEMNDRLKSIFSL